MEVAKTIGPKLIASGTDPRDIPDEQGRVEDDGSLTIFVSLPDGGEVSMTVPKEQWTWRHPSN